MAATRRVTITATISADVFDHVEDVMVLGAMRSVLVESTALRFGVGMTIDDVQLKMSTDRLDRRTGLEED